MTMRLLTIVMSGLLVALGVALVVRTALAGAGLSPAMGYVAGGGMVIAGLLRTWMALRGGEG